MPLTNYTRSVLYSERKKEPYIVHGPLDSVLNASSILADVKAQGARTVVAALWSDNGRWNQVMANIGDGKPKWLEVAVALRPGTDAGAAETLDEAIFFALN